MCIWLSGFGLFENIDSEHVYHKNTFPIFVYHGKEDKMVKWSDWISKFEAMRDNGNDVEVYAEEGLDHHIENKNLHKNCVLV